jgi:hypothetical protein
MPATPAAWYVAVGVINFDVDIGHVLESFIESDAPMSAAERELLPYAAMPDSQPSGAGGIGDEMFCFRFARREKHSAEPRGALWGFSCYRARRDPSCKRGVYQKAVVLLTPLPLFRLWRCAVRALALEFFGAADAAAGTDLLREALAGLRAWPPPRRACGQPLPLLGRTMRLEAARANEYTLREHSSLAPLLPFAHLCWSLWQLLLSGRSVRPARVKLAAS